MSRQTWVHVAAVLAIALAQACAARAASIGRDRPDRLRLRTGAEPRVTGVVSSDAPAAFVSMTG